METLPTSVVGEVLRRQVRTRPLIDALRLACVDMVNWLVSDYGFDKYDAVQLLGQTAHLYIANVVDPQFSVACALNKKYLPK